MSCFLLPPILQMGMVRSAFPKRRWPGQPRETNTLLSHIAQCWGTDLLFLLALFCSRLAVWPEGGGLRFRAR